MCCGANREKEPVAAEPIVDKSMTKAFLISFVLGVVFIVLALGFGSYYLIKRHPVSPANAEKE